MVLGLAQGCTVGPRYGAPAPPMITTYTPAPQPTEIATGTAGISQQIRPSAEVSERWWSSFESPALDGMVHDALANSPTLAQAKATLLQAQEELNARRGATKHPSVSGNVSVEEEQLNLASFGIPFPNPSPFTLLNGSVAVSYVLDLFGANRRLIESLQAERDYQAWQLEGARQMLAGNVVAATIRQAQLREEIEITRKLLAVQEQQLAITEQRRAAGGASDYDLHSQRRLVAQTRATLPQLEQQVDAVNDQLAVLMGQSPAEAHVAHVTLSDLHLPEELPLSLPSSLVRQRPDIRAAEALLHQASANVGIATANLYPQIVLSGSGGGLGTSFTSGGDIWNVGASLTQPIYNGGALRAEKRKAQAAYEAAGSVYQQTVLKAFQQVADTLHSIQHDAQTLNTRTEAANEAAAAYRIAAGRYQAGGVSQLAVLDSQRQQLQAELDRLASLSARFADSATLFEALGGGWWNGPHALAQGPH